MELPWIVGALLMCLSATALCETNVGSQIRNLMGMGIPSEFGTLPGAVIVFINNGSTTEEDASSSALVQEDLLDLATDLQQRDKEAVYVHFDGDNLITSQASLFNDLSDSQDSWLSVLDKIKKYRTQDPGAYSDLLVFESHPEGLQSEVSKMCDRTYDGARKCKVINADLNRFPSQPRFRRAADEVTTAAPTPATPAQRANIPQDSVAAFHLLFWTSLAIALTVWGFAYGMWHMDPGRDSIIYRMTSAQKFKKDK